MGRWRARAIMKLAALDRINRLYSDALAYEGPYPEGLLHAMDVRTEVDPREADRIPPEGPAIVIANHPTGALDGIVLIDWLSKRRPDARFMGNYLLSRIGPLKRYFISVDPFDAKAAGNVSGMREAMRHLSRGGLLVIFPAGEVATWRKGFRDIGDREWPRGGDAVYPSGGGSGDSPLHRRAQQPSVPSGRQAASDASDGPAAARAAQQEGSRSGAENRIGRSAAKDRFADGNRL